MNFSKRPVPFVLSLMIIWTAFTILAVTWGFTFNWPDYLHVNYGFPLVWATHTLSTIAGPVDKWSVDISALLIDLVFWQGTLAVIVAVVLHVLNRRP